MKKRHITLLYKIVPLIAIVIVGFIIYSDSLDCSFHFDDGTIITENPVIRDIGDVKAIWNFLNRRFVGTYTFALNYRLHGYDIHGYHLTNILIHITASMLVYWLALLLLSTPIMRNSPVAARKRLIAAGCGLLFLTHPLQTQAITYIVQRYASLASMFYLASLALYVRGRLSNTSRKYILFAGAVLSALLGILTKEIVVTLPFAVLLIEVFFFKSEKTTIRAVVTNKMFLLSSIPAILFLLIIPALLSYDVSAVLVEITSQRFDDPVLTSWIYLMTQFRVLATYLRLMFFPLNQNFDYDYPASRSFFEPSTFFSFLFLGILILAALRLYRKHRLISFGILWFFITLSVESSIKPLYNVIFEHRLYLPMFGFAMALTGGMYGLAGKKRVKPLIAAFVVVLCVLSALTFQRNKVWKDEITLWSDTLEKSPNKSRPNYNLGLALYKQGNVGEAMRLFNKAIEIDPTNYRAYNNIGLIYSRTGDMEGARRQYEKALEVKEGFSIAYNNLGQIYFREGNFEESKRLYQLAQKYDPDSAEAYYNLGNTFFRENNLAEARKLYLEALQIDAHYAKAYNNLGLVSYREGDIDEAKRSYLKALECDPRYAVAYNNLGLVLMKEGKFEDAAAQFRKALGINPRFADAHSKLASCYRAMGNTAAAEEHLAEVKRLTGRRATDTGDTVEE